MDKKILLILLVLILVLVNIIFLINLNKEISLVCFEEKCFNVELAVSENERSVGLMNREFLDKNSGMLFIFPEEGNYGFWMENTLIPLDIVWISEERKVVHIEREVPICEEDPCIVYGGGKKALYVLEVNAGLFEEVEIGEEVNFS